MKCGALKRSAPFWDTVRTEAPAVLKAPPLHQRHRVLILFSSLWRKRSGNLISGYVSFTQGFPSQVVTSPLPLPSGHHGLGLNL